MSKQIEWQVIDSYCLKNKRPSFVQATDEEWNGVLGGTREQVSEMDFEDGDGWDTPKVWTVIWFGAIQYFNGRASKK
jgi:hypothetical protein